MATSLLALLDDIATLLDDVSVLSKAAARKTAGVLGDDLALNAQQVTGLSANRELPIVWAVFKGSLLNKVILVPAALAVSVVAPWAVVPLLMLGGAYLCYEGFEKVAHRFLHDGEEEARRADLAEPRTEEPADGAAVESARVKGAVRTDFILSAEIIVITLGIVADAGFPTKVAVLAAIALLMTLGVYGLVAAIVKLDDVGLYLVRQTGDTMLARTRRGVGAGIVRVAPVLMKTLSVVGTAAMFLVGGGILVHGIPVLHHWIDGLTGGVGALRGIGGLRPVMVLLINAGVGLVAGAVVLAGVRGIRLAIRPRAAGS